MAFTLKMKRGFYCSLSLRATTLILASVSVLLSLNNFVVSDLIVYHDYETPDEVIRDDFDVVYDPTTVVIHYHEATTHEPEHANVAQTADPHHREFYYIIVTLLIFDGINTVLALADMIVTCLLIFGAARINGDHRLITTEDGSPAMADGDYLMVHSNTDNTVYKVRAQAQVMDFFNLKVVSSCDDSICTASPSPASPCSDDADSLSGFRWKDGAIKALVAAYKEEPQMSSGKTSCKKVWEMIAGMLNDTGHEVTGPQCKTKMASLKKTYKSIKDHNNKSGNDRRSWPYFETRSTFILLWLYFGVVLLVYDAVYIIAHLAIGMHFIYTIGTLFHILLVAYLWAVAWNLYEDCRDAELRAAAARVSMTVVTKDNPCTVSYNQLSSA